MDFFNKLTGDGDKKPGKGRANATSGGRVGSGGGGSIHGIGEGIGPNHCSTSSPSRHACARASAR